jgi:hypothetical protein
MTKLRDILETYVDNGSVPGAVGLVARADRVEVQVGGSVDEADIDPWNVRGRYGWVGGTGTPAHITPSTDTITILLTQAAMTGPTPTALMRDFWRPAVAGPEV